MAIRQTSTKTTQYSTVHPQGPPNHHFRWKIQTFFLARTGQKYRPEFAKIYHFSEKKSTFYPPPHTPLLASKQAFWIHLSIPHNSSQFYATVFAQQHVCGQFAHQEVTLLQPVEPSNTTTAYFTRAFSKTHCTTKLQPFRIIRAGVL